MTNTAKYILEAVTGLLLLSAVVYGFIEYRKPVSNIITDPALIVHIMNDTRRIPNFIGIFVVSADIQTNTKMLSYMYIVDPEVRHLYEDYYANKVISAKRPLFTDNDTLNLQVVSLINHKYNCWPYLETSGLIIAPTAPVAAACTMAVPVDGVEFVGYVTIFFSKVPTEQEKAIVGTILFDIVEDITPTLQSR